MRTKTTFNGDMIDGIPVITELNVNDLEDGKIHRFMFQSVKMNIGHYWYVPVIIAKGIKPGKKLLLITGIHGDELNGTKTMQLVFDKIDPQELSGTVIGVFQASPNSMYHISRHWHLSTDGGGYENMNRLFPGDENGNTAEMHAYKLWNHLWKGNADYVVDMHSQSTDTEYPLFIYADYKTRGVQKFAEMFPADQLINDSGDGGTVEDTFNEHKIPAITMEIGGPRRFQIEYIERAVEGICNAMAYLNMYDFPIGRTAEDFGTFIGYDMESNYAETGGYAEVLVNIGDIVKKGDFVALQRNVFGDIIKEYYAKTSGIVASIGTGATREAGGLLVRILTD